ncbi:MAG: hypothetical protein ABW252_24055 [Polyangiales bacterium]
MSFKSAAIAVVLMIVSVATVVGIRRHGTPRADAAEGVRAPAPDKARGLDAPGPEDDEYRGRLSALVDEVAALREEVAALRGAVNRGAEPVAAEAEPTAEQAQAMWEEHMTLVEAGFNEEPTDARWANESASLIQRALSGRPALQAASRSTECRSQTCRMELETDAQGKLSDDISSFTRALGDQLPTVRYDYIDLPGGRQAQVLYLSRESADANAESDDTRRGGR